MLRSIDGLVVPAYLRKGAGLLLVAVGGVVVASAAALLIEDRGKGAAGALVAIGLAEAGVGLGLAMLRGSVPLAVGVAVVAVLTAAIPRASRDVASIVVGAVGAALALVVWYQLEWRAAAGPHQPLPAPKSYTVTVEAPGRSVVRILGQKMIVVASVLVIVALTLSARAGAGLGDDQCGLRDDLRFPPPPLPQSTPC